MQNVIIKFGSRFERISEGNYDVRDQDEECFVDDFGKKYSIHVRNMGDGSWGTTLVYDDDNVPEDLPDYVQIAQEIEAEYQRAEQTPGMTAIKLMQQVAECQEDDWQNSDMWPRDQAELETISAHFQSCEECRAAFDAQEYPEETIQEFATAHILCAEDWICEREEVPLPSELAWGKIETLKEQIEAWDCEDVGALRNLIEQATEALRDYNEKYPSGAGPDKIEELLDFTSLPSAELPEDLAKHTNYPIWACDKSGACLVGAGADTIETADEIREGLGLPLYDDEEEKEA